MTTHIFEIERDAPAGKHTLDMIALFSGMTREAVRQIETKAIKKMAKKHPKILKELKMVMGMDYIVSMKMLMVN